MKPIIILPPNTMSKEDIKALRENDLCVVESSDPSKVKFVDPIPAISCRTEMENAAIKMSRLLLTRTWGKYTTSGSIGQSDILNIFVDLLIKGTPLDPTGTFEERQQQFFSQEKRDEISRIAREEAREERRLAKEQKTAKK